MFCAKTLSLQALPHDPAFVVSGLLLTVTFEFAMLVRNQPTAVLLDACRFRGGNIWSLVLLVIALSPVIAAAARGLLSKGR